MYKVISLKKYSRILWEMEIFNAETNVKSSVYARKKKQLLSYAKKYGCAKKEIVQTNISV